ncbi:hypothetical protein ENTCAN_07284 [Enterobacter cancerogenus ATCC 35316]|nr:hypothetical protein ENTCAN_07284 [Enterobacter cancerogenus ATCC 35316]
MPGFFMLSGSATDADQGERLLPRFALPSHPTQFTAKIKGTFLFTLKINHLHAQAFPYNWLSASGQRLC